MNRPLTLNLSQALTLAQKVLDKGHTADAEKLYSAILTYQPGNKTAQAGLARIGIRRLPELYYSGRMNQTEQACKKILKALPDSLQTLNIMGAALKAQGKLKPALDVFTRAVSLKPDFPEGHNNRGNVLIELGRTDEAVSAYETALRLKPEYAQAAGNLGNALRIKKDFRRALDLCNRAIALDASYAQAYNNRGTILTELDRHNDALTDFAMAVKLQPTLPYAHSNLGNAFMRLDRPDKALCHYKKALSLSPDAPDILNHLGACLMDIGNVEEASTILNRAITLEPGLAQAYTNLGNAMTILGQSKDAEISYKKAVDIDVTAAEAHYNLAMIKTFIREDPAIPIMQNLIKDKSIPQRDIIRIYFALSKAYLDTGNIEEAFQCLHTGNAMRKKELGNGMDVERLKFQVIRNYFDQNRVPALDIKPTGIRPVFIVGMPRSGTTLVEQILASHSKVYGAGELPLLNRLVPRILPKCANDALTAQDLIRLRKAYLTGIAQFETDARIIIDKMPGNLLWVGFIRQAFPEAGIIYIHRDPMATCWSIYRTYFSARGLAWAYDMNDLAQYFLMSRDLGEFWKKKYSNAILDVQYETLTEDQENQTRRILAYCGLPWDPACLDFHKSQRAVRTASSSQVRKKMFKGSSNTWKRYSNNLKYLIAALR